ncbi:tetratricopeptide repeat protein [Ornithinimicrobium sp. INDO-MA30-4]|uniref:tetratricopeptide repeat protein n=1 Tax=Ornithinimicrobium sp. INDO-MA30-4 TaxID=2908651 RepID=UPI001F4075C3|nr:tetratricopeptide repeat protein [Ornithinimicrobium sp. INDO-MA30-4]UJH71024.1 tetratricopeptide repeat protein [Ornithinimicrobium sp. INDO-MA30-4]
MSDALWDQKIEDFYEHDYDEDNPAGAIAIIDRLVSERPPGDAAGLFELAAVRDSFGLEAEAIPLYRAALTAGLRGERANRVVIQLASSLRNVGQSTEAVRLLESLDDAGVDESARLAFLALAQFDEGRQGEALRTVLHALIPHLDGYGRALAEYADALPPGGCRASVGPFRSRQQRAIGGYPPTALCLCASLARRPTT